MFYGVLKIQRLRFYHVNGWENYCSLFTLIYRDVKIAPFTFRENYQSFKEFTQGAQPFALVSYLQFVLRIESPFSTNIFFCSFIFLGWIDLLA